MAILLSAHKMEKNFASRTLFRGLTFAIESGDRIGLIGPNGAGKSTLLKILSGQMAADGGDLSINRGCKIALLQQTPQFTPGASVYETLLEATSGDYDPDELAKVDECLSKLDLNGTGAEGGVTPETLVEDLSGGWQKRVALARELVRNPDLLLLDEPTNHLDVEGIQWLEEFMANARFATVTITHDRLFLQRVANRIFDLDPRYQDGLLVVKGEYVQYLETRDELLRSQERREVVLRNTLSRETEWLRRGAKARTTKQTARIGRAGDLKSEVEELAGRNFKGKLQIDFQESERNPQRIVEARKISKSFDGRQLFKDLDFIVTPKTRLGLLGPNGCGKSTLIRCLLGTEPIDSGEVKRAERIEVAYFEQHRETLDPKKTLLRNICDEGDYVNFRGQYVFARSYLDRFLFRTEQHDMPVEKLSGGEQARLRVAQMMLAPANILIMDEPTNDLDLATMAVLEEVLSEFNGAVILVTHDRYFLDQVSNRILAFGRDLEGDVDIEEFASFGQWEQWNDERQAKFKELRGSKNSKKISGGGSTKGASGASGGSSDGASTSASTGNSTSVPVTTSQPAKKKTRKLSFNEQRELETMDANIQKAEARIAELQAECSKSENAANAGKLADLFKELGEAQAHVDKLYARWAELEKE